MFDSRRSSLELSAGSASDLRRYAADVMDEHRCTDERLCDDCYGRQLRAKGRQAEAIGQTWAERICRGELRAGQAWPEHEPKTLAIARRLVGALASDPRLLDGLAAACSRGAAAWWQRRPSSYRVERDAAPARWSLVTGPDERERCCVVIGGERCGEPAGFRIAADDGALDDYTYTCAGHLELAAGPGYVVTPVERERDHQGSGG
jgi:hypothetical protein